MKLDWNIRLTSILNALLCCFYAFNALIYHTTASNIQYFTSGATISIELATGFFMTDFLVIVLLFTLWKETIFPIFCSSFSF